MTIQEIPFRFYLGVFVLMGSCLFLSQTALGQAEKMDIVQYTAPHGWVKTPKDFGVVFSDVDQKTGKFCILTVYASKGADGAAQQIFADQWAKLIAAQFNAGSAPKTESESADGWITTAGASKVAVEDGEAFVLLTVFSGFDKVVSVVAVFNDHSYLRPLEEFVNSVKLDKSAEFRHDQHDSRAKADRTVSIYGVWGDTSVSIANYVTPSGTFVGSADVATAQEYEFRRGNIYVSKFFGSGGASKPYYSETTGTFKIDGSKLILTPISRKGGYSGTIRPEKTGKPETFDFYIGPNKWNAGPFLNLHKEGNYYLYSDFPYDYYKKIEQ